MLRSICLAAALGAACTNVTPEELDQTWARLECQLAACLLGTPPSLAACATAKPTGNWARAVAAGRLTFDGSKAPDCLDKLEVLVAAACWGPAASPLSPWLSLPPECDGAFVGKVGYGDDCWSDEECTAGFCDESARVCPGQCQPTLPAGGSCSRDRDCGSGRRCLFGTCVAPGPVGTRCNDTSTCEAGLGCMAGLCSAPVAPGGDCGIDGAVCTPGHWCRVVDDQATCIVQAPAGAECRDATTIADDCVGRQICVGAGQTIFQARSGVCAAPSDVGGPCRPRSDESFHVIGCFQGLLCDPATSACVLPPPPGRSCIDGECDAAGYCASGACVSKKAVDQPCVSGRECLSGACDGPGGNRRCGPAAPVREEIRACLAPAPP